MFKIKSMLLSLTLISGSAVADIYNIRHAAEGFVMPVPPTGADQISCSGSFCCAIVNQDIWSVGHNLFGQLGVGDNKNKPTWVKTNMSGVTAVSAGFRYGYAIKDGVVWSVGDNSKGKLARGGDGNVWGKQIYRE